MSDRSHTGPPVAGWAAFVVSFALIGLTVALFGMARNESVDSSEAARQSDAAELMDARRTLELSGLDVVVVRMLDGVGVDGDRSERLASGAAGVRSATTTIERLATDGRPGVADEAAVLFDDIASYELGDPTTADIADLYEVAEDVARYSGRSEVVTSRAGAIHQLGFVGAVPLQVLVEGAAADVVDNERSVDPSISEFVDEQIDVVQFDGGWYGPDATAPFDDSVWIELEEATETFPVETAELEALTVASPLVGYDAWMRGLRTGGTTSPPMELADAESAAVQLAAGAAIVIDELIADEAVLREAQVAARQSSRQALLGLTVAAGILALVSFAIGALTITRSTQSSRRRAELAMRDALTGVGNRHELYERTSRLTVDPRFDHHVIAMIDLDRFKMVNDLHGHAAGDAVLIEIASRLHDLAAAMTADPASVSSVVRLGGDEFLLTLHGTSAFDVEEISDRLDSIRQESVAADDIRIGLGFSLGVVSARGANDLSDLMRTADLAVYDDKSGRAGVHRAASGDLPSSESDAIHAVSRGG